MMAAIVHEIIFVDKRFTKTPIFEELLVNKIRGITAKLSCIERITWLNNKRLVIPFSPYMTVTMKAGMIAMALVINLLSQGFKRICRNPSMTI